MTQNSSSELKTIDIVDELIHSITRRHIPDYPEATIAINKIDNLLKDDRQELLKRIELPAKRIHFLEARMDTDLEHGQHIGEVEGYNQALKDCKAVIEKYIKGDNYMGKANWAFSHGEENCKGVIYGEVGFSKSKVYPMKLIKIANIMISNGKETKNYKAWFDNDIEIMAGSEVTFTRTKSGKAYLTTRIKLEEIEA